LAACETAADVRWQIFGTSAGAHPRTRNRLGFTEPNTAVRCGEGTATYDDQY
jgi:hypothetical protein